MITQRLIGALNIIFQTYATIARSEIQLSFPSTRNASSAICNITIRAQVLTFAINPPRRQTYGTD
jgi:hypothetical protein